MHLDVMTFSLDHQHISLALSIAVGGYRKLENLYV